MTAETLTTGAVAKRLGVAANVVYDAVHVHKVVSPSRAQGGSPRLSWEEKDVATLTRWVARWKETETIGAVAKRLRVGTQTIRDAIKRGVVTPTFPSRGRGSPCRFSARDIETLRIAFLARAYMLALVGPVQKAAKELAGGRSKLLLAVGPNGSTLTKRGIDAGRISRRVGFPFVVLSK